MHRHQINLKLLYVDTNVKQRLRLSRTIMKCALLDNIVQASNLGRT